MCKLHIGIHPKLCVLVCLELESLEQQACWPRLSVQSEALTKTIEHTEHIRHPAMQIHVNGSVFCTFFLYFNWQPVPYSLNTKGNRVRFLFFTSFWNPGTITIGSDTRHDESMLTRASDIWSNSCSETATVANATSMVDAELSQASFLLLSEFASFSACTQRAHPMCQEVLSCKLNEPNVSWSYFLKDSVDWPKQRSQLKFLRRVTHMTPVHANPSCHCTAVSRISHG